MHANSRRISSNQRHLHPRLAKEVRKHLQSRYLRPVARHNREAYRQLQAALEQCARPLVLDSFCGTGQSTAELARRHPHHLVVGIDKSAARLARHARSDSENYLLLQADCEDIWQLLAQDGLDVERHYLLYPNPWPKAAHLQRRVHGHPSFPLLLHLAQRAGGYVEVRSNWQLYVEEFGVAMHLSGSPGRIGRIGAAPPITLFERKYLRSGHDLWAFTAQINGSARRDEFAVIG